MIMTEFGAAKDTRGDLLALSETVEMADEHRQSWMYWQFKYFQDITTCTPQGESLYNDDGSVCTGMDLDMRTLVLSLSMIDYER